MKQILLFAMALTASAVAFGASLPYYSDMGDAQLKAIDPQWTIINETAGSNTWVYDGDNNNLTAPTGAAAGIKYQFDTKNAADDWAISPDVQLTPGVEYKVSFWMKTANSNEDVTVYLTGSTTPDEIRNSGRVIHDFVSYKNTSWAKYIYTFSVAEAGSYRVAFFIHSQKNMYNVFLRGFTLSENVSVPEAVTNLTCTPGADHALTVALSWTLPTSDTDGNDLTAPLQAVHISRDGEEIAQLPGNATAFTDTEATGLESGFHTYSVRVDYQGQTSRPAEALTSYVGPVKPMAVPFSDNMENELMWELWTVIDPADDATSGNPGGYKWTRWANTSLTGYQLVYSNPGNGNVEDDWVFTPALALNKPGTYKLKFDACMYNAYGSSCNLDVYLATAPVAQSATVEPIASYQTFATATYPTDRPEEVLFTVTTPGTYYLGFYEHAETSARRQVRLDNFEVTAENVIDLPVAPAEFTLTATREQGTVKLAWTNPSLDEDGLALPSLSSVKILRDEVEIAVADDTPGASCTYTDQSATRGAHTYTVVAANEAGSASASARAWAGENTITVPYSVEAGDDALLAWDEENGCISISAAMSLGYYQIAVSPEAAVTVNDNPAGSFFADRSVTDDLRVITIATTRDNLISFSISSLDMTPAKVTDLAAESVNEQPVITWSYPTATAAGVTENFEILHATLYRDDEPVASFTQPAPGAADTFTDAQLPHDGLTHIYALEVGNLSGNSERAEVRFSNSGVSSFTAEGLHLTDGVLVLASPAALTVTDMSGRIIYTAIASRLDLNGLARGIYLVNVAGKTFKIIL